MNARILRVLGGFLMAAGLSAAETTKAPRSFEVVIKDPASFVDGLPARMLFAISNEPEKTFARDAERACRLLPAISAVPFPAGQAKPKFVAGKAPVYPRLAKEQGQSGFVDVLALVNVDGRVIRVLVVNSTDPIFELSAAAAVMGWRFTPTVADGRAVPVIVFVRSSFASRLQ